MGDPFTCTLGSLAAGTSATITFVTRVTGDVTPGGTLINTATVSASTPDSDSADNTASASTSVVACTITAQPGVITSGTAGNDVICGSAGPDRIAGLGGNDIIFGLGGDDQLDGGDGNDVLAGGPGSDQLVGGNGDDSLLGGGGGVDRLAGGAGDDVINTVDGSTDDYAAGGEHVTGDTCVVDAGHLTAQCER